MTGIRTALLLLACVPAMVGASLEPREPFERLEPLERLEQQTRRVYVFAVDKEGAPITDLTAEDFTLKENGKERPILSVAPATGLLQIALLIDDNGTGLFRVGVARFIEALLPRAEFSISTVTGQMLRLVDYTSDAKPLSEAIAKLNARPSTNDGGQLLDGISEAALELEKREARRPVIIALTVGGQEHSTLPAHHVLDNLRKSGASLHVLTVVNNTLRSQPTATSAAALLGENMNLSEVLGDGPKQSGGGRDEIIANATVLSGLQRLGEALKRQYVIEYTLPDGVKPSGKLSVSVKRKGVTLHAPTRVPDK
jgi:Ca-activated chloride channel homolog